MVKKAKKRPGIGIGIMSRKQANEAGWKITEYDDSFKNDSLMIASVNSIMVQMETAIDELIRRINTQTQRIKDMM